MRETPDDMERLQMLLDRSVTRAGAFLRSSFEMPEHSLSATQLVRYLEGVQTLALATVTAKGEPRVAPTGAVFYRGRFCIPTVATAARTRHISQRPAVSITHYVDNEVAIVAHGHASIMLPDQPDFAALEEIQRALTGEGVRAWGDGVYLCVEAEALYTYVRHPERYPA